MHVRCSPWPSNNVQGTHDSPKFVRATSTSSEAHTGDNQSTGNSPRPVVHMTGHGVNVNPSDVVLFDTHKFVRDLEKAGNLFCEVLCVLLNVNEHVRGTGHRVHAYSCIRYYYKCVCVCVCVAVFPTRYFLQGTPPSLKKFKDFFYFRQPSFIL